LISIILSIGFLFLGISKNDNREAKLCLNNAIPRRISDGISACAAQSIVVMYASSAISSIWFVQSIDLFLRNVCGHKQQENNGFTRLYLSIALILPLLPISVLGYYDLLGYSGIASWCFNSSGQQTPKAVLIFYYIPGFAIGILSTACIFCVLAVHLRTLQHSMNLVRPLLQSPSSRATAIAPFIVSFLPTPLTLYKIVAKAAGPAVLFNMAFLLILVALIYPPFRFYIRGDAPVKRSYDTWVACMFRQLKLTSDASDSSWKSTCGETPYSSFEGSGAGVKMVHDFTILIFSGQSIVVALVFLPSKLSRFLRGDPSSRRHVRRDEIWRARLQSLSLLHRRDTPLVSPAEQPQLLPSPRPAEGGDEYQQREAVKSCNGPNVGIETNRQQGHFANLLSPSHSRIVVLPLESAARSQETIPLHRRFAL
jgi:hypothetical protein